MVLCAWSYGHGPVCLNLRMWFRMLGPKDVVLPVLVHVLARWAMGLPLSSEASSVQENAVVHIMPIFCLTPPWALYWLVLQPTALIASTCTYVQQRTCTSSQQGTVTNHLSHSLVPTKWLPQPQGCYTLSMDVAMYM